MFIRVITCDTNGNYCGTTWININSISCVTDHGNNLTAIYEVCDDEDGMPWLTKDAPEEVIRKINEARNA